MYLADWKMTSLNIEYLRMYLPKYSIINIKHLDANIIADRTCGLFSFAYLM